MTVNEDHRLAALELASGLPLGDPAKIVPLAREFAAFLAGDDTAPVAEIEKPADKPTTRSRKQKDADPTPTSETSTTLSSADAGSVSPEPQPIEDALVVAPELSGGDDLVVEPQPEVSEVNAAVLAACKPDGIGRDKVVELLSKHGSTGGVPGLPKDSYRAFLNDLEVANG